MRHLAQTLTLAAALAGAPCLAQTATDRPTKESPEPASDAPRRDEGAVVKQGDTKADVTLTQAIKKAIEEDKRLSFHAKNVKVFTTNGQVTLRGRVLANQERTIIREHATAAAGENRVIDELEVRGSPTFTNQGGRFLR